MIRITNTEKIGIILLCAQLILNVEMFPAARMPEGMVKLLKSWMEKRCLAFLGSV